MAAGFEKNQFRRRNVSNDAGWVIKTQRWHAHRQNLANDFDNTAITIDSQ